MRCPQWRGVHSEVFTVERCPQLGVHSGGVHSEVFTVRGVHSERCP